MHKKTVALFGAFDRFNYGDLLFPGLVRHLLEEYRGPDAISFEYVSLKRADLTRLGGETVHPARWLTDGRNLPDDSALIVAGGEILAAYWSGLHAFLLPVAIGAPAHRLLRKVFSEATLDEMSRRYFRVPWTAPFVPSPEDFPNNVATLFNAVGGSGLSGRTDSWKRNVSERLAKANYVSVRDRETLRQLEGEGVPDVQLCPDIAILLSEIYPLNDTANHCRAAVSQFIESGDYISFQVNCYCSPGAAGKFARQLDVVQEKFGLNVVLVPIGRAAGHADQIGLQAVADRMSRPVFFAPLDLSVREVLALLANAKLYAGTSLHGIITAMSYGVPHIAIRKIPKIDAFLDTWALPTMREVPEQNNLADAVAARITDCSDDLAVRSSDLRAEGRARFAELADAL